MVTLTLGSLFDGIGGWLLAAQHNDIKPVWSAEIAPFPASVSKHRFPDVMQLGDITKIKDIPPVDIICAGSPCQNLSVAGNREGLNGKESSLFYTAIKLVRRSRRKTGKPIFFVWENVKGALSSNHGADFKSVLEEITESSIPMPGSGRWAKAGMVRSGQTELAWRIIDAQFWGVPQHRERIFLVARFDGGGELEILFEPKSLSRDSEKGKKIQQETADGTAGDSQATILREKHGKRGSLEGPVISTDKSFTLKELNDQILLDTSDKRNAVRIHRGISNTLQEAMGNGGGNVPICYDMSHANRVLDGMKDGLSPTLTSRMGTGGTKSRLY